MQQPHLFDLTGIDLNELEVLTQEGARGIPEFAASSGNCTAACFCGGSSGAVDNSTDA